MSRSGKKIYEKERAFPSCIWRLSKTELQSLCLHVIKYHIEDPEAEDVIATCMAEVMRRFLAKGRKQARKIL